MATTALAWRGLKTSTRNDLFDLSERRALITGSGRRIGFALARGLGTSGASGILNDVDEARVADAAAWLKADGIDVGYTVFDVTDHAGAAAAVAGLQADVGAIDILVNNAAIQRRAAGGLPGRDLGGDRRGESRQCLPRLASDGEVHDRPWSRQDHGQMLSVDGGLTACV